MADQIDQLRDGEKCTERSGMGMQPLGAVIARVVAGLLATARHLPQDRVGGQGHHGGDGAPDQDDDDHERTSTKKRCGP
jgi:hypothetical protein